MLVERMYDFFQGIAAGIICSFRVFQSTARSAKLLHRKHTEERGHFIVHNACLFCSQLCCFKAAHLSCTVNHLLHTVDDDESWWQWGGQSNIYSWVSSSSSSSQKFLSHYSTELWANFKSRPTYIVEIIIHFICWRQRTRTEQK